MIGAYQDTPAFAYPGWRLTVPGGPAGGHYKGFTHTESTGTDIPPNDQYEQDREDGMSSHDAVHASPLNPRGVYRSPAEVPPRPNASGAAHTYRSYQTQRHAGTSVAPGSFPAPYSESGEDDCVPTYQPGDLSGWGLGVLMVDRGRTITAIDTNGNDGNDIHPVPVIVRPNTVSNAPASTSATVQTLAPSSGATSVVNQPTATLAPAPPSPSVPVYSVPPISPTPAPTVATNEVIPLNDGSGNYINVSTGAVVPASSVTQNLATMQLTTASAVQGQLIPLQDGSGNYLNPQTNAIIPGSAISQSAAALPAATTTAAAATTSSLSTFFTQETIFPGSGIPDVAIYGAGVALALLLFGGKHK